MKNKLILLCLLMSVSLQVAAPLQALAGEPANAVKIYDETADGNKQIAEAIASAKRDQKRVLIVFGANWCIWCRRLHQLFDDNKEIAAFLKKNYVVVSVDLNEEHNKDVDAKYGHPRKMGIPALLVLDTSGKVLTKEDSGKLEAGDHHDPSKVMQFLQAWKK